MKSPRAFGSAVNRLRGSVAAIAIVAAVLSIFLIRPVTVGAIIWVLVGLLAVLLLVELSRRPSAHTAAEAGATPQES